MGIWFPRDSTIKICATGSATLTNSTVLDTAFSASGTAVTAGQKGVTITPGMHSVDIVQLMGVTAQGGTDYQNAEMEEKPPGLVKIAGSLVHQKDESGYELSIFGSGTSATTHTTYEPGQATPTKVAMLLNLDDGTDEVNYAARNMVFTQWELASTGADGHFEVVFEAYCLPKDFFGPQFKN